MDVYYSFDGELYCWNADKATANVSKHGVTFEQACEVFADDLLLLEDATAADEARLVAIGLTLDEKLRCVVHLVREDEVTRIISAHEATASERKHYENESGTSCYTKKRRSTDGTDNRPSAERCA